MNNLVFNTTASQLKTAIYGEAPDTSLQAVKVDASQHLLAAVSGTVTIGGGTITVSEVTAPVTIGNASLTVAGTVTVGGGTVTVSEVTAPITIGNASLTVAGTVTVGGGTVTVSEVTAPVTIGNASLTVAGTVTVAEVTAPVTIGNASLTVAGTVTVGGGTVTVSEVTAPVTIGNASLTVAGTVTIGNASITTVIGGSTFVTATIAEQTVTGTDVLLADTDISTLRTKSIFLYNGGSNTITISLQYSPTTTSADYVNDTSYTDTAIAGGDSLYIAVDGFAHYMRLQCNMSTTSETISGYLNAQA